MANYKDKDDDDEAQRPLLNKQACLSLSSPVQLVLIPFLAVNNKK